MSQTPPAAAASEVATRLDAAIGFAREGGAVTLRYFGTTRFKVETKRDGSEVTTADRETEQCLRALIERAFPEDGILGEEFGEKPSASGWRWVLDPIDGTASFVHGVPLYGTLVACEFAGQTRAGVIHMPALGEMVYAGQGGGAWHVASEGAEPVPARVSGVADLGDAMLCTTSFGYYRQAGSEAALGALFDRCGKTRGWSDCYAHVLCATGRIEAVVEPVLYPWDIAPMQVIYAEAGGRTTDWAGRPGAYHPTGVSTNGLVHGALLDLLRPFAG
jgi:histidinol phosphatase-like enzyme (inositol monophosphatase family)